MGNLMNANVNEKWWSNFPRPSWNRFEKISQGQNWFDVYRIQQNLFAIYESGNWEEVISHLILGTKRAVLFDTGMGIGDMKKLVAELSPVEPIVINSHSHFDHIGGNFQFQEIYAIDTEFSRVNSKGIPHEKLKEYVSEGWIWKETPNGFEPKTYAIRPYTITKKLQSGDRIDLGDRVLEIVVTPGEATDGLCLLDRNNRLLFTGDTFYPAILYSNFPESNFKQYKESAAVLYKLMDEVDFLLTAHNETYLPSSYLGKMYQAFVAIEDGSARYKDQESTRQYFFDGFYSCESELKLNQK